MIKALIVDDSTNAIESLTGLLKIYLPQVEILGYAMDVDEGIFMIKEVRPELVFLDIEIKAQTGFDLLKAFPEIDFEVIFVTGYNEYAIEAFNHNALHYLVKPIVPEKLIEAVNRLKKQKDDAYSEKIRNLSGLNFSNLQNEKRIIVKTEKETRFIWLKDILYVNAEGRYSIIHLDNKKKIIVSRLLKEMESQFKSEEFFRVNKSFIINLNYIDAVKHIDGGLIKMTDGTVIQIPRRKRDEFTIKITNFMK